jgi:Secretion system C-terminal sorting domain
MKNKMKKTITTFILCTFSIINLLNAQAPNWSWASSAGGIANENGFSVATDASGNVFAAGIYASPTITFGAFTLTNTGNFTDIYLVKYNASGTVLWAKTAGGIGYDNAMSVATDANGNVFMVGFYRSPSITFETTTLINTSALGTTTDLFIAKYDTNGNLLWAKSEGGTTDDGANSLAIDANGNAVITGLFESPQLTIGTTTLTNYSNSGTNGEVFVSKYDTNGNALWAKSGTGDNGDAANNVAIDAIGNVIITGSFYSDSITFENTTLLNVDNSGAYRDVFITKYDANGNLIWAVREGNSSSDECRGLSTDASGNIYISGAYYDASINFGTTTLTNADNTGNTQDVFLLKYNASGTLQWAKGFGGTGVDFTRGVATDAFGYIYVTGAFYSPTITIGTDVLTNAGGSDILNAKYNSAGNVMWANSAGGITFDYTNGLCTNANGNLFITGYYDSPDITFGTTTLINSTNTGKTFIAKLDSSTMCLPTFASINETACASYTSPSGNYNWTSTGTYTDTITNVAGCDSILTINLTINPTYTNNASASICQGDTYTFPDGTTATSATVHTSHLSTANACDSSIVTTLTVNPTYSSNVSDSICFGDTYTFPDGTTTTTATIHTSHFNTVASCDSSIVTTLTINCTVGINETTQINSFLIYPNPTSGQFTIVLASDNAEITITDILGQQILKTQTTQKTANLQLDNNGIYIVYVTTTQRTTTRKLIVNR